MNKSYRTMKDFCQTHQTLRHLKSIIFKNLNVPWWIIKSTKHYSGQHNAKDTIHNRHCLHLITDLFFLRLLTKHRHFVIKIDFKETIVQAVENRKTRTEYMSVFSLDIKYSLNEIYFVHQNTIQLIVSLLSDRLVLNFENQKRHFML